MNENKNAGRGPNYILSHSDKTEETKALYHEGYDFYETHWPDGGPSTPVRDAMQFARFSVIDMSQEANYYWAGYADAYLAQASRDAVESRPMNEDELYWVQEQITEFVKDQAEKGQNRRPES